MKSLIGALFAIMLMGTFFVITSDAAMYDRVQAGVITSTGTTIINLNFRTNEIWFVRTSTDVSYINLTSSAVTTSDKYMRGGVVIEDTSEVVTNKFSVTTSIIPFTFYYEARGWKSQ